MEVGGEGEGDINAHGYRSFSFGSVSASIQPLDLKK
jgi:hypothetical protein